MEKQNNDERKLGNLETDHEDYGKGGKIIARLFISIFLSLIFITTTIYVYEKVSDNVADPLALNQVNTTVNKDTITNYGYEPDDFTDFIIDSIKIYSSMNILLNSNNGDVTAQRILPEQITNSEIRYRNKISELIEDNTIVTKIYIEGDKLKCTYNEEKLLNKLGVSSHMGVGLISMNNESKDGVVTYTFSDKFANEKFNQGEYYVSDYNETTLNKNYYSGDQRALLVLISDKSVVQSDFTIQMAKIMSDNKEAIELIGPSVKLNVNNELQDVGYNLKNLIAIGKDTKKVYTFDTTNVSETINKDSNLIWVVDGSTGLFSCYMLKQGSTSENPIAENIEHPIE